MSDLSGPVHAISIQINRILSKRAHAISKILFILEPYKLLADWNASVVTPGQKAIQIPDPDKNSVKFVC